MNDEILWIHPINGGLAAERPAERRDALENRARVLDAARRLFARRGVAPVTMAEIAEEAGVGKGTLYRRFANKGELCLALLDEQLMQHQEQMLAELRDMDRAGRPYLERLRFFLTEVVVFTEIHIPLLSAGQPSGLVTNSLQADAPYFAWQHMTVSALLQAGVSAGEVDAELDLPITVDLLLAPLTADYFRYLREQRGFPTARIAAAVGVMIDRLAGVSSPVPGARRPAPPAP